MKPISHDCHVRRALFLIEKFFANDFFNKYLVELQIKGTKESNTFTSYLHLLLSIGWDSQLFTSLKDPGTALMETKPIQLYTNENRL